ncbi:MAG: hypothetical protein ABIJ82_00560 [Patescibacteria group bacterium]
MKKYIYLVVLFVLTIFLAVGSCIVRTALTKTTTIEATNTREVVPTVFPTATPTVAAPTADPTPTPTVTPTATKTPDPESIVFLKFEKPPDSTLTDLSYMYQTIAGILNFELTPKILLGDTTHLYSQVITYDTTNNTFIDLSEIQLPTHPEEDYVGTLIIAAGGIWWNETERDNSTWGWWWEKLTYCAGITRLVAPESAQVQFGGPESDDANNFVWDNFFDQITDRMKPSGLFATIYVISVTEEEYQKLEQLAE